jgi:hypothetical protein
MKRQPASRQQIANRSNAAAPKIIQTRAPSQWDAALTSPLPQHQLRITGRTFFNIWLG